MTRGRARKSKKIFLPDGLSGDEVAYTYLFAVKLASVIGHKLLNKRPIVLSLKRLSKYFVHHRLITSYLHKMFKMKRDGSWLIISATKSKSFKLKEMNLSDEEIEIISEILS